MNNPVGFFLNLDQGDMSDEQVVQMLAGVGYQCIEYGLNHLNPRAKSSAQLRQLVDMTEANGLTVSEWVIQHEFVHRDDSVRRDELELTAECIRVAGDLGIGVVNCFSGPAPFMGIGAPTLHHPTVSELAFMAARKAAQG